MLKIRACLFLVTLAAVSGCGSPPPKPPAPRPQAPAPAPDKIDGIYRGTSTRFQADSHTCPHPGPVTLYVQDRKFSYHWNFETWVDSFIYADGTVQGQGPGITLLGRKTGRTLEGDVTNGLCGLHFTTQWHDF
jgi:hypothetical protein